MQQEARIYLDCDSVKQLVSMNGGTFVFPLRIDATVSLLATIAIGMHAPIAGLHHWAAAGFAICLVVALVGRLYSHR